ncbi:MAG TPA: FkbM family methyltransferase [Polyangiales bacterium]|jgi:FkbM family methyltransferase|nr:FkbM family methyltransferase [Polyangiales bacterium]
MLGQFLKHLVVHTPFEGLAQRVQHALSLPRRARHPELSSIHEEPRFIESACRMLLRPESNAVDIGAHLGSQLGRFVDLARFGRHLAFEPVPYKARWLRRKFPNVDVRELALHEAEGRQTFFVNESRPGYSGLRRHEAGNDVLREITVDQHRLDEVVDPSLDIDLIKIDVEGAELFVLRGATRLLDRCRPTLLFESTKTGLATWQLTPDAMYTFLRDQGYRIYLPRAFVCGGTPLDQDEFAVAHEYPFRAFNFIGVAKDRPLGRQRKTSRRGEAAQQPVMNVAESSVRHHHDYVAGIR